MRIVYNAGGRDPGAELHFQLHIPPPPPDSPPLHLSPPRLQCAPLTPTSTMCCTALSSPRAINLSPPLSNFLLPDPHLHFSPPRLLCAPQTCTSTMCCTALSSTWGINLSPPSLHHTLSLPPPSNFFFTGCSAVRGCVLPPCAVWRPHRHGAAAAAAGARHPTPGALPHTGRGEEWWGEV